MAKKTETKRKVGEIFFPKKMEKDLSKAIEDLHFPGGERVIGFFRENEKCFQKLPEAYIESYDKGVKKVYRILDKDGEELSKKLKNGDKVGFSVDEKSENNLWAFNIKLILKAKK